ncbi:hypothetical protein [Pontibacillus chungwhensis]|uniref:hypothetical protein n=1 Tax=Pontibacillus chungwhensis TaxID=265426 RepID=UPI000A9B2743|nr:hypothetical protein [Pontibacillus chungwhensis]
MLKKLIILYCIIMNTVFVLGAVDILSFWEAAVAFILPTLIFIVYIEIGHT